MAHAAAAEEPPPPPPPPPPSPPLPEIQEEEMEVADGDPSEQEPAAGVDAASEPVPAGLDGPQGPGIRHAAVEDAAHQAEIVLETGADGAQPSSSGVAASQVAASQQDPVLETHQPASAEDAASLPEQVPELGAIAPPSGKHAAVGAPSSLHDANGEPPGLPASALPAQAAVEVVHSTDAGPGKKVSTPSTPGVAAPLGTPVQNGHAHMDADAISMQVCQVFITVIRKQTQAHPPRGYRPGYCNPEHACMSSPGRVLLAGMRLAAGEARCQQQHLTERAHFPCFPCSVELGEQQLAGPGRGLVCSCRRPARHCAVAEPHLAVRPCPTSVT